MALQLSVWDVYGIEVGERLLLVGNFTPKCFFLRGRLPISFKRDGVLCERDSHPQIQDVLNVRRTCVYLSIPVFSCFPAPAL